MPPKRTRSHTLSSEETPAKRLRRRQEASPKNGKHQKRQTGTSTHQSSTPSSSGIHRQEITPQRISDPTTNANDARFSKIEKSIDELKGSVEEIAKHTRMSTIGMRNDSANKKKLRRIGTGLENDVKASRSTKIKTEAKYGSANSVSAVRNTLGQKNDLSKDEGDTLPSRRRTYSDPIEQDIDLSGTSPCTPGPSGALPSTHMTSNTSVSSSTSVQTSSGSQEPKALTPDDLDMQGLSTDDNDIPAADLIKLVYLATKVQRKRKSTRKPKSKNLAEEVGELFKGALDKQSFNPVRNFVKNQMISMKHATYTKGSDKKKWSPKSDFMSWFLSMKHLNLDASSLESVAITVRKLCDMENINEVEGAFMNNESLVMSKICDLMTTEQVRKLMAMCSEGKEAMPAFTENTRPISLDAPGMKELVYFYIIRYLELKQKFNTLYTDLLLEYIVEIRSSQEGSSENLDQVCKILETYEIQVRPAGYCLVFCVLENRPGAEQEIINIENTFETRLGYKVVVKRDPTLKDIEDNAKLCSESAPLGIYDSFVCFLLAHGDPEDIILFGGGKISRKYFLQMFAKETCFPKKPKLFLMGSCQGSKVLPGKRNSDHRDAAGDPHEGHNIPVPYKSDAQRDIDTVHAESDRLVAYATLPNHAAFRNGSGGSYFVTFICKQIEDLEKRSKKSINVVEVLQRANRRIHSILFPRGEDSKGIQRLGKQACYYESTLQKNFCFRLMESRRKR